MNDVDTDMVHISVLSQQMFDELDAGVRPPVRWDPPYESPIEAMFANRIQHYVAESVDMQKQVWIKNYRVDFLIDTGTRRIVIECDGKEFHTSDKDRAYDTKRDTEILASGKVDSIVRIPGHVLFNYDHAMLVALAKVEPAIFGPKNCKRIQGLANVSWRVRDTEWVNGEYFHAMFNSNDPSREYIVTDYSVYDDGDPEDDPRNLIPDEYITMSRRVRSVTLARHGPRRG